MFAFIVDELIMNRLYCVDAGYEESIKNICEYFLSGLKITITLLTDF